MRFLTEEELPPSFSRLRQRYSDIYVILSPPRCSSTALARVFWEEPSIRYYSHEPFEVTYYENGSLADVAEKLENPIDLSEVKNTNGKAAGDALVIKEMPYQAGDRFRLLASLATQPLVFLIRDPKLSIASRMEKKVEGGEQPVFPKIESGWDLLSAQVELARLNETPHYIVDATELRNEPEEVLEPLFDNLGLEFSTDLLDWEPCPDVELDNLEGKHRHLYRRVLASDGLLPANEDVPAIEDFPEAGGFRAHVERCIDHYRALAEAPERIRAEG